VLFIFWQNIDFENAEGYAHIEFVYTRTDWDSLRLRLTLQPKV